MALKSGYNFTNLRTPSNLKNCKLENPSLLFGPLAQYLGSDKRRVLGPCVTNAWTTEVKTERGKNRDGDRLSDSPKMSQMEIGGTSEVGDMI